MKAETGLTLDLAIVGLYWRGLIYKKLALN